MSCDVTPSLSEKWLDEWTLFNFLVRCDWLSHIKRFREGQTLYTGHTCDVALSITTSRTELKQLRKG
jgi:hypothetical protein